MNWTLTPEQQAAAQAHLKACRAQVGTGPEWPDAPEAKPTHTLAVVGAGTMGVGIALAAAQAGVNTLIMDISPEALNKGLDRLRTSLNNAVNRKQLSAEAAQAAWQRVRGTTLLTDLAHVDAVIEAVYENIELKAKLLAELGRTCAPHTWLASNTSTLDIDHLGQASGRPDRFVGTHFLTPAHIVPLVEVVCSDKTNATTLSQARGLIQRMGKLPIQTANQWGFIGNRIFEAYLAKADELVLGGIPPARIDTALEAFGMAMGPCRTVDMAGLDIANQVIEQRHAALPHGYPAHHRAVTRRLAAIGRLGVKTGQGHYVYDGKTPLPDPHLPALVSELQAELGVHPLGELSDEAIVTQCVQPLMAEGEALLREGVAHRASDIDLVWVVGYGFPANTGGPMHLAAHLKG